MSSVLGLCLALLSGFLSGSAACPAPCDCRLEHHVLCANRGLLAVPALPPSTSDILVLSLAGNFIGNVSASDLGRFPLLTRLDLQYNRIRSLPPRAFRELPRLEELYLGNNLLPSLSPGTLGSLGRLRVLDANSNEIEEIGPGSFAGLDRVVKLRLDGNSIAALREGAFEGLGGLLYLHLESNSLGRVHGNAFAGLERLRLLNLSDNRQTELRDVRVFSGLASLTTLLLAENGIRRVGARVFQGLGRLSTLCLSNNNISVLEPGSLSGLSALRELLMDGNRLEEIPARLLEPLESAEELDLSRNRISRVDPAAFSGLARLRVLRLAGNRLSSLPGSALAPMGGLHRLELSGNEWECDCALAGLRDWIRVERARGGLLQVFVRCVGPAPLAGRYLDYLDGSQLQPAGNHSCAGELEPAGGAVERVQADQGRGGEAEPSERREADAPRARPPLKRARAGPPRVTGDAPPTAPEPARRSDPLQRHRPLVADACQFNRLLLANVTADRATPTSATVRWGLRDGRSQSDAVLQLRVRYDRLGPAPRFPRYVYAPGSARSVTLRELVVGVAYLACVEGVVGGAVCGVASRDHCAGVVSLRAGPGGGLDLQPVTAAMLAVNALLLLLVGGAWAGRGLRRRLQRRKSSAHVRHMYSARRPLGAMATDAVSADFTSYQTGDLMQFPCDRFLDNSGARRDEAVQRFQD